MPGVPPDMNTYRDFEQGNLRTSSYIKGGYGKSRSNGIEDFDQSSSDVGVRDGNFHSFEVDHLATYTSKSGTTRPEDGLTKLKQMESSTGIWTMRCMLIVERGHIVIIDKASGDELERFPMAYLHEPTAVLKNDHRETYNNLVLFTILDDPKRKNSPSDMHIFQSVNAPAQDIVDEILAAKNNGLGRREPYDRHIPPPPSGKAPEPLYSKFSNYPQDEPIDIRLRDTRLEDSRIRETSRYNDGHAYGAAHAGEYRAAYIHREDMDTGQNEVLERDVQLLNNCFDDIEKFVSRLQQAAEAHKELERRRLERGSKKKQKSAGDGMLMMRARPPPADDFVDIFQKLKFAFNLLAKLKAHIHDPNAPELVHFLFTPLSLIYEASRDPIHGGRDLSNEAVVPLLIYDAKQLLINCLTSRELELWQRLGKPWTLVKDEWNGHLPSYNPKFYNGWQPLPQLVDEINQLDHFREDPRNLRATERIPPHSFPMDSQYRAENTSAHGMPTPLRQNERRDDYVRRDELEPHRDVRSRDVRDDYEKSKHRDDYRQPSPQLVQQAAPYQKSKLHSQEPILYAPKSHADENMAFAAELKRMNAIVYVAVHGRQAKNQKELTVEKGDIFHILDKSRNWWKLKNCRGDTGYAPYTILEKYQPKDNNNHNVVGRPTSGDYSNYINGGTPPAPPPPTSGSYQGARGDAERRQWESPHRAPKPNVMTGERSQFYKDVHDELLTKINPADDKGHINSSSGRGTPPQHLGPEPRLSPRNQGHGPSSRNSGSSNQELKSSPRSQSQSSADHISPEGQKRPRSNATLSQYSTTEDVKDFLEAKGFSKRTVGLLAGYSGVDMFNLQRQELEHLLGRDEGRHLDSLLTVQKSNAGFHTRGASELHKILEKRKERFNSSDDNWMGSRPSFMPETAPDYSPPESEASSDSYGDAGKTLRNLLEHQRRKIEDNYRGPYQ